MPDVIGALEDLILHAAGQWWVLVAVYLLCTIDGFFPVVPSESVLVALAAISDGDNTVSLWWVWLLGGLGAVTGDQIAYWMGRRIGVERFRWMRIRHFRRAVQGAQTALAHHGALVICTARYIPGGRVAVNYTAGATGYSRLRFTLLDVFAAFLWSAYSIGIARATSGWLDNTLLQIVVAVIAAAAVGWLVDVILQKIMARMAARRQPGEADAVDSPRD
ncbi:DedA family protein [Citricoccus sp. GCM10030269]|uniref:DedA family protein n=1 Tax=Citricoccus sp. GCM10030269 TaxID=3273388 RepID=UPI003609E210